MICVHVHIIIIIINVIYMAQIRRMQQMLHSHSFGWNYFHPRQCIIARVCKTQSALLSQLCVIWVPHSSLFPVLETRSLNGNLHVPHSYCTVKTTTITQIVLYSEEKQVI